MFTRSRTTKGNIMATRKSVPTTTVPVIAQQRAKARSIDTSRAAKDVRARLRSNFSKLVEAAPDLYGPKGSVKKDANDGNRWGAIPTTVADSLFTAKQ